MAVKDDMPADVRQRANVDNPDWYAGRPATSRTTASRTTTLGDRAHTAISGRRKQRTAAQRHVITKFVSAPARLLARVRLTRRPL